MARDLAAADDQDEDLLASFKGTTFFICVSRPAHALISASGEKKKKKIQRKCVPLPGQVRVDKYCPQQSQRKRLIARRKQQYYGD